MERTVNRLDLRSASPSLSIRSDDAATQRLKDLSNIEFIAECRTSARQCETRSDAESLEFRLFSTTGPTLQSAGAQVVRIRSPSADPAAAGFVQADRSRSYYFTPLPNEEEQRRFKQAALSIAQVKAMSVTPWPGSTYEWKLQHFNRSGQPVTPNQAMPTSASTITAVNSSKHCKLSKAARIRQRVSMVKLKAERRIAETTKVAEREKKAKRNREKKLKKKAREKAKKAAGQGAEAEAGSLDGDEDEES